MATEVIEAESARFTSPLLLVHGLWSTGLLWRRFMGYLAHRGWVCIAVDLHRHVSGEPATSVAEHVDRVRDAIAALEAPPIVVGHDLGALLALSNAHRAAAVVALAPLVPPPLGPPLASLQDARRWLRRFTGRSLSAPRGRWRAAYDANVGVVSEPAALIRRLQAECLSAVDIPERVPGIVFAGDRDPVTPVHAARALADHVGAEFSLCAGGGHVLPVGTGWEDRAAAMHRWVIQRLGTPLLALYEEEKHTE